MGGEPLPDKKVDNKGNMIVPEDIADEIDEDEQLDNVMREDRDSSNWRAHNRSAPFHEHPGATWTSGCIDEDKPLGVPWFLLGVSPWTSVEFSIVE